MTEVSPGLSDRRRAACNTRINGHTRGYHPAMTPIERLQADLEAHRRLAAGPSPNDPAQVVRPVGSMPRLLDDVYEARRRAAQVGYRKAAADAAAAAAVPDDPDLARLQAAWTRRLADETAAAEARRAEYARSRDHRSRTPPPAPSYIHPDGPDGYPQKAALDAYTAAVGWTTPTG